jgi:hypothetical protein
MDDTDEDEYWLFQQGQWDSRAQEPMRDRTTRVRVNPSPEDRKVRRRNRRATAGGDVQKRAELVRAVNKASSLAEQARLLDELTKFDQGVRAQAAQASEVDFANTVVGDTLTPVRVHEHHTAATDWLGYEAAVDPQWHNQMVAEAATWFGRVPDFVKADPEEFSIQAAGKARQLAGPYGLQMEAASKAFTDYAGFLRAQAASGLDQIQQTIDGNNQPKTTPLPTEVFDTFAPEVDPINAGVSGTEDSNRAPLIQEIVNGGSGADGGAPEKPGGHSTGDELSWSPPEGMQQDSTAPLSYGQGPEGGAGTGPRHQSALIPAPSPAIGYTMTMDDYLAARAGGQGKGRREAASGLPMIQETVDANNQPHAPTPIPPAVAFPLDPEFQAEWTTNGTGNAQPGAGSSQTCTCGKTPCTCGAAKAASRKQADMYGNSDAPHAVVQPDVANTPATTPPPASAAGGSAAGVADARANEAPTFGDDSAGVPTPAQQYAEGYSSVPQGGGTPDIPASVAGPGKGVTHAGAKVSSLIVTAAEKEHADFRKGYGYASRWTPGTRLVSTGSKEFEAGLYAGISDNAEHQRAFVEAHRAAGEKYPKLAARVARHKEVTAHVVSKNDVGSNGLYLVASTSMDLPTMAPNTSPAADGSTPINGPGRPGPLDGQQEAATPGGPSPYNGAEPFGTPVVPTVGQTPASPADELTGGGGMSTTNQVMGKSALAFRQRVQAGLLAERQGK